MAYFMRCSISFSRELLNDWAWGTERSVKGLSQGAAVERVTLSSSAEEAAITRRETRVEGTLLGALMEAETSNRKFKICYGSDFPL